MGEIMALDDPLDESIWSHLPPEILERVLHRLPLEILYRFRSVCKHWRSFPSSPQFCASLCHPRSRHSYLLGLEQIGSLALCPVHNPSTNSWSFLDLGFLESRFERFSFERWSSYDDRWGSSEVKGATSDGGLLCVSVRIHESEQDAIFVCNPLTKACHLLPLIEGSTWGLCLGLSLRMESYGHYRVFVTKHGKVDHSNRFEQRLYMYDSLASRWKLLPKCPRFVHDSISGVFCNGVYYALYGDAAQGQGHGHGHDVLMAYDVEQEAWVDTGVAMATLPAGRKKLVVGGENRLFCVASARDTSDDLYMTVVEVDLDTSTAVKISSMEHLQLPDEGLFHHKNWHAIGYRNAIVLFSRSPVPFVFDFTEDLPEWKTLELAARWPARWPRMLVAFTFDLRATVE